MSKRFLVALEEAWEDPPLPRYDHDHPAFVGPDWPPVSEFDQAIYRVLHDHYSQKEKRLRAVFWRYGYSKHEANLFLKTFTQADAPSRANSRARCPPWDRPNARARPVRRAGTAPR